MAGLSYHTAITYGASGLWFYNELPSSGTPSSVILSLFCRTEQAYIMGILFLLAGYFTPGSVDRKGYAQFLSDRFLRLGVPLLASADRGKHVQALVDTLLDQSSPEAERDRNRSC